MMERGIEDCRKHVREESLAALVADDMALARAGGQRLRDLDLFAEEIHGMILAGPVELSDVAVVVERYTRLTLWDRLVEDSEERP